jgi:phenylacetate-CoA ligase
MIYPKILKEIFYPIGQLRWPEKTFEILRLLNNSQWWSLSELKHFQYKRLQALLKHAYQNTPYYHRLFNQLGLKPEDIRNVEDLQQLPILTKEIIRNNLDDLVVKDPKLKISPDATSGSTGEPMRFFADKRRDAWNMAAAYREWLWAGYEVGDKIACFWRAPEHMTFQKRIYNLTHRRIVLDTFNMTERDLDEYFQTLRKFRPKVIQGYTSALYLIARYLEHRGVDDIKPKVVLTSSEMLFDYQRETIERVFGCEVFDYYGGRDTTLQAGECPEHCGYHLAIETSIVEFIKEGQQVSSGELGKIVITDLFNYAMPFIRYEIGDLGVPSDEMCSCGRGLPLMKAIEGRTTDLLRRSDGGYISSPGFTVALGKLKKIKQFQIIQKKIGSVTVKVVKGTHYTDEDSELLEQVVKRYLGEDTKIDIQFVDSIPTAPSGKYRFTISEVPIEF